MTPRLDVRSPNGNNNGQISAQHEEISCDLENFHLPKQPPVELAFSNLTYHVTDDKKNRRLILKSVSGIIRAGELTAIMGPSGAGKSSLLNNLSGYRTDGASGLITVNGTERNLSHFRKQSCYIMQDNQLHDNLRVAEAMTLAANLKLPDDFCNKQQVIDNVLETLGLFDHKQSITKKLSGGQKKRLSIALELINNPPVMFFDEPTSGLDSSSCYQCIKLLKDLSRGGRTVICTIHQPSARLFEMFDQLYTLAQGQCVYQGSTSQLVPWLASNGFYCLSIYNPANYIIELTSGEKNQNLEKLSLAVDNGKLNIQDENVEIINFPLIANHDLTPCREDLSVTSTLLQEKEVLESIKKPYPTSEWTQFWTILRRTALFTRRDKTLMYLRLSAYIIVGLVVCILYNDVGEDAAKVFTNVRFLFFNALFVMYGALTVSILSFPLEMPVLRKETFNGWYPLRPYYLAMTLCDFPFQVAFTLLYTAPAYYFTGQPLEWDRFGMFFLSSLLTSLVSQSLGIMVGSAMNIQNGVFFAQVLVVPLVMFSGVFLRFSAMHPFLRWISDICFVRYGFEGVVLAVYGFNRETLPCISQAYCRDRNPHDILQNLEMENANYWFGTGVLVAHFAILRILAYIFLRSRVYFSR
ncbi:ATP-binding cassette subfamily G member 4-like isoform X2 [Neocloeon triangulifer]|uniref:ATP-binding cassette subfamily G member 4-like isoform X2 n=1 Tax=Neocloeon triangulifer TaxID=2078957 RepID=UPI00286F53AC|nr:ATP-binding cassette subfamily G member 4-like isoform X2 [Neocloeon triangulifer]